MDTRKLENYRDIAMAEYFIYMADEQKAQEVENYIRSKYGEDFLGYFFAMFVIATTVFFEEVLNKASKDKEEVFLSLLLHIFSYFVEYGVNDKTVEIEKRISFEELENLVVELSEIEYTYFDLLYIARKYFGAGLIVFIYRLDFFRRRLSKFINFSETDEILMRDEYDA